MLNKTASLQQLSLILYMLKKRKKKKRRKKKEGEGKEKKRKRINILKNSFKRTQCMAGSWEVPLVTSVIKKAQMKKKKKDLNVHCFLCLQICMRFFMFRMVPHTESCREIFFPYMDLSNHQRGEKKVDSKLLFPLLPKRLCVGSTQLQP